MPALLKTSSKRISARPEFQKFAPTTKPPCRKIAAAFLSLTMQIPEAARIVAMFVDRPIYLRKILQTLLQMNGNRITLADTE